MSLAPLRSLDDFILQGSRFQVPDINQAERCFNRIVSNLLYYQTNYFLSSLIIFLLVTFLHPQQMALGIILLVSATKSIALYFTYVVPWTLKTRRKKSSCE